MDGSSVLFICSPTPARVASRLQSFPRSFTHVLKHANVGSLITDLYMRVISLISAVYEPAILKILTVADHIAC